MTRVPQGIAAAASSRTRRPAFTVIELLIVVSIIIILAVILVMVWPMVKERIVRLNCSLNLAKCQRIMFEYGANNSGYLPPMSGANHMGAIEYPNSKRHYVAEELKTYGASAAVFTCPATSTYENERDSGWYCWERDGIPNWNNTQMVVSTTGYVFFVGFYPWLDGNRRYGSQFYGSGSQPLPDRIDSPGNPPLGADRMGYFPNYQYGKTWNGWFHQEDSSIDAPGGGGHTLWLSGTVEWAWAEELLAGAEEDPPTQPIWWGSWPSWTYLARWRPSDENTTPD